MVLIWWMKNLSKDFTNDILMETVWEASQNNDSNNVCWGSKSQDPYRNQTLFVTVVLFVVDCICFL